MTSAPAADSLKSRAIRALSWSLVESAGLQGVRFIVGMVLARLLFPEQFGLVGMLTIFTAVAQSLLDSGFGAALIQKSDATQADMCSIFYFNILAGLAAAGLLCLAAPWIAAFYNQPVLTSVVRAMSLTIVVNSLGLIQSVIRIKRMDFKTQTKISLTANVLSGAIAVILAFQGFGVWSLVVQQVLAAFSQTACLWLFNTWRPSVIFSFKSLREMSRFGTRLLASGLLNQIFDNIYSVVIGRAFALGELGFFARAKSMGELPSQLLCSAVGKVAFPVFSVIQGDEVRLKRGMKKALTTLAMVNFPIAIGLAAIARPLVIVLLTEKWSGAILYLQLISLTMWLYPAQVINLSLLQALGRSTLFLRLEIIKKILIVINVAITWRWGVSAMICGIIALTIVNYGLNSYYAGALIGYPVWDQIRDFFPYLIASMLMGASVYLVGLLPFPNDYSALLTQALVGVVTYAGSCRLFRLEAFMDMRKEVRNRIPFASTGTTG